MLPEWYDSPRGEQEHRAKFEEFVADQRFCSINVQAAIQDEERRKFYQLLNSSNVRESE